MIPIEPMKLDMPFAYEGARNEIPTTGGESTGNASLSLGFPPITSEPLIQGGIPPQRKDFNGLFYILTCYAHYAQSGGLYAWDESLDYVTNCIITHNNNIYICVANNGVSTIAGVVEPGSDDSYWKSLHEYLIQADGQSVGSSVNPIYLSEGRFVASTASVGGTAQPVRLNNGIIEALTETIGASDTPIFLKAGVLTACTSGGTGVKDYKLSACGYVRFECGLIIQWGNRSNSGGTSTQYTVKFPLSFTSSSSYVIVKNGGTSRGGTLHDKEAGFYNKTKSGATTTNTNTVSCIDEWLAVGY